MTPAVCWTRVVVLGWVTPAGTGVPLGRRCWGGAVCRRWWLVRWR